MSKWEMRPLGDIATVIMGLSPDGSTYNNQANGLPLLNGPTEFGLINPGCTLYTTDTKRQCLPGDLIFCVRGSTTGRMNWADKVYSLGRGVCAIRGKNPAETKYVRYCLDIFLPALLNLSGGSTMPNLNKDDIGDFELPYTEDCGKIAAILSAYDDLIENNTRRIALLEKMAEEVYREWFVRLRFPGYERVPVHHGIPDGWAMLEIKDLIKRVPAGKLYSDATALPNGSIPILDQGRSGIIGYHNDEPSVIASMENPVIVFANHTCNQRIIWFPFSAIQNVLPFVPSENLSRNIYWLHYAIVGQVNINSYKGHYPEFIAKQILVPSADLAEQFGIMSMRNFQMIVSLREANEKLKATRDMLLSRLLSGKVEVENLEIAFPVGMQGAE